MNKHLLSKVVFSLAAAGLSISAMAQDYPSDTIRVTVPFAPGGGTDFLTRTVMTKMAEKKGWTIVVENKPGAAGSVAMNSVHRAKKDGYDLVLGQTDTMSIAPSIYVSSIKWDPVADFKPIGLMATTPLLVVSNSKGKFQDVESVIKVGKEAPNSISYASPGMGSISHLAVALLAQSAGADWQHIPYKGAGPAMSDLLGERVELYAASIAAAMPQITAGNITPLAVTSDKRASVLPDTPTLTEAGYPAVNFELWYGLFAPAGVPQERIDVVNKALKETLADPDLIKILADQGLTAQSAETTEMSNMLAEDLKRWPSVIKTAGVEVQ